MPLSQKSKGVIIVVIIFTLILAPFCYTIIKEFMVKPATQVLPAKAPQKK